MTAGTFDDFMGAVEGETGSDVVKPGSWGGSMRAAKYIHRQH